MYSEVATKSVCQFQSIMVKGNVHGVFRLHGCATELIVYSSVSLKWYCYVDTDANV